MKMDDLAAHRLVGLILLAIGLVIAYIAGSYLFTNQHTVIAEILVAAVAIIYGEMLLNWFYDYFFKGRDKQTDELIKTTRELIEEMKRDREEERTFRQSPPERRSPRWDDKED